MKTIVIVEDELFFRKSVCKILNKQEDYQVIGEANNGLAGMKLISDLNPDIAIIDISMPLMNGLEMIRQLRPSCNTKFILLTGYEEFEYAQQAISLGCKEYLLKPLDTEQLLHSLKKVKEEIDSELSIKNYAKNYFSTRVLYDQQKNLNIFYKIILGNDTDEETSLIEKQFHFSPNAQHIVILFNITQVDDSVWDLQSDYSLLHSIMQNICLETFAPFFDASIFINFSHTQQYLILETQTADVSILHNICEKFAFSLKNTAKISLTTYCGNFHKGIKGIRISYEEAISVYHSRCNDITDSSPVYNSSSFSEEFILTTAIHEQILLLLRQNNFEKLQDFFNSYFKNFEQKPYHIRQLWGIAFSFLNILREFLLENNQEIIDTANLQIAFNSYQECQSLPQLKELLTSTYHEVMLQTSKTINTPSTPLITNVKKYVQNNYKNLDLQLKTIATHFYVSPQYLSTLFSQESNMTLTSYILEYRMKKAKELLLKQSPSIQHAATLCGFNDSGYFSKCFKKYYGISPKNFLLITEKSKKLT